MYIINLLQEKNMHTLALIGDYGKAGGIRTYFKQLLTYFTENASKLGVSKILVFFYQNQYDEELKTHLSKSPVFEAVLLPRLYQFTIISKVFRKLGLLDWYEFQFEKLTVNKILKHKPDAVIYSISSATKFLYALTKDTPALFISHTLMLSSPLNKSYRKKVYDKFKNKCNPKSRICAVSEIGKTIFQQFMPLEKTSKLYTIFPNHCGYATEKVSKSNQDTVTVLTLGLLETFKNPDLWLSVAKSITDKFKKEKKEVPDFIWAGSGSFYDRLKEESKSYPNIKFIGYQTDTKTLYETCDIYVQPSTTENCSLSVIDALKYSLPCVVSNIGGLPEQVIDGHNGFLCTYDRCEEFVYSITKLLDNKRLRTTYGKNSRKIFEEKYTQEQWNKNFSKLLKDIL